MKSFAWFLLAAIAALGVSCSEEHQDLPAGFAYDPPATPTGLTVVGGEEQATVRWSYPAGERGAVGEFRVYEYYESYDMIELVGTTTDTVFVDSLLIGNLGYCYKVSAVDTADFEGWRTESVCAFVRSKD
jgi:hypothetical protein